MGLKPPPPPQVPHHRRCRRLPRQPWVFAPTRGWSRSVGSGARGAGAVTSQTGAEDRVSHDCPPYVIQSGAAP